MAHVALRYAQAFADVVAASELNREQVRQQLDDFAGTLAGSRELRELLENPSIDQPTKVKVLDAALGMRQRRGFRRARMRRKRRPEDRDLGDNANHCGYPENGLRK